MKQLQSPKGRGMLFVVFALFVQFFIPIHFARAVVAVTTATGGSAISADTTGVSYSALTGPVISEGATGDVGTGTIILNAPSGFIFDTGGTAATVLVTRTAGRGTKSRNINGLASGSTIAVTRTTAQLTITITSKTTNSVRNSLTWQNVRVRPSAGTPLASGNIIKTGTSSIVGITDSITNFGTLTEVVGAKSQLAFTTQPSASANVVTDFSVKPVVKLQDQFGNTVTSDNASTVTLTPKLSTQTCAGTNGGGSITSTPASGASVTAGIMAYTAMQYSFGESIKICAASAGVTSALSSIIAVVQPATKFVISAAGAAAVDAPIIVTVQAQKPDNSVDTSYSGGVTLVTSGSSTGGGLVTITGGAGTKAIADTIPETVHLSLSDTQSTGLNVSSVADVTWSAGATTQLSLNHPATLSAGSRAAYTVTRKDQYGNVTTSATTTVYFYSSSSGANKKFYNAATAGSVITSLVIPPGQSSAQVWYYDELSGSWSITASDNSSAPDGATGITDAVDALAVIPGSVGQFILNNPGNMTGGTRLGYTVTRKDSFGNLVTGGASSVYLYSTAGAPGVNRAFYTVAVGGSAVASVTINGGSSNASFWYYENTPGSYIVSASDNAAVADGAAGIADGTANVTVIAPPIVATRFVILNPTNGTVDSPVTVTVQAQNNAGDIDTSATSSVTLITSGFATGGGIVTLVSGVGTIQISDHHAETVTATLSDTQSTGLDVSSTKDIVFAAGATAQFSIDNPGDMSAGTRLGFTVTRKDQYGNLVTSGIGSVYLYSSSVGVNKKFYNASSGGSVITSVNILGGQSSASFWYYDELSGSATVTVSDNATAPDGATGVVDTQRAFAVVPAAIAGLTMNDPGNMTAGTRLGYTITRKDQFNNLVTSGVVSVYLYSSSVSASTKFYDAAVGGFSTTLAVFPDGNSTAHFWYYDEAPGTWVVTASDSASAPNGATGILDATDAVTVTATPIVAMRLVIQAVSNSTVGVPVQVSIRAEDNSGNVDTTNNAGVTLNVTGSATGGGLVTLVNGVGTVSISDTVSETVTLSLSDTQNTGLNASSTRTVIFSESVPAPVESGWLGAGGATVYLPPPAVSKLHFSGKAFPGANIHVIAIGGKWVLQKQTTSALANGNFSFSFDSVPENTGSYGVFGTDKNNHSTQFKIFDANLANSSLLLDVDGILLSPTLGLSRGSVTKGDTLGITGLAAPANIVEIEVDNHPAVITVKADSAGAYKAIIPTASLEYGSHTVRTRQISPSGLKSDFCPQAVFSVVNIFTPNMDFNRDAVIDVKDWSIFVSRWSSHDPKMRIRSDLNGDGKTDVQDLSIFVRTLKK